MSPDQSFLAKLVAALGEANLEALVVGSTAAVMQGAPVMTRDIDLLIRDTPLNRRKLTDLSAAIGAAGPVPVSELTATVTLLGGEMPVDVLFDRIAGGLTFESLKSRALEIPIGSHVASVASLVVVIQSKEAAGREKDLLQLPTLRNTLRLSKALKDE